MLNQRRADGTLRHLITLEGLNRVELDALLDHAQRYVCPLGARPPMNRALEGFTLGNLFTEPSTRTRVSFELAARRLGAEVVNLEVQLSSRAKGETMLDTIHTLESLHFDGFIIRDSQPGVVAHVAANVAPHVSVFSAGEAHLSHPTQGLLDALTVRQHKGALRARSLLRSLATSGIRASRARRTKCSRPGVGELRLVAPPALMPASGEFPAGVRFSTPEQGLAGADVVMMLRIQKERMAQADIPDGEEYFARYGLTPCRACGWPSPTQSSCIRSR
jgi:aspartate carbamoyltransferase catalytic subunit